MGIAQAEKAERLRALHEGEPFVIPNPWDPGSARVLAALGFEALATSSSALAFTFGKPDGGAPPERVYDHIRALSLSTELPVSADLENGFGPSVDDAATAIERAAEAGAVGGSIEDFDPEEGIYEIDRAAERVAAAAEAASGLDFPFALVGRAENHIRGNPDLDDTIARLIAYEKAGADVLYAPGLRDADEIAAVCGAVTKPVNVLARGELSVAEIFAAGAQRISVGGSMAWVAIEAMADAATAIRDDGDLSVLRGAARVQEWLGAASD
jgi:2-methylisocitrate lyase-like PEP mutase family enzyme